MTEDFANISFILSMALILLSRLILRKYYKTKEDDPKARLYYLSSLLAYILAVIGLSLSFFNKPS